MQGINEAQTIANKLGQNKIQGVINRVAANKLEAYLTRCLRHHVLPTASFTAAAAPSPRRGARVSASKVVYGVLSVHDAGAVLNTLQGMLASKRRPQKDVELLQVCRPRGPCAAILV